MKGIKQETNNIRLNKAKALPPFSLVSIFAQSLAEAMMHKPIVAKNSER